MKLNIIKRLFKNKPDTIISEKIVPKMTFEEWIIKVNRLYAISGHGDYFNAKGEDYWKELHASGMAPDNAFYTEMWKFDNNA